MDAKLQLRVQRYGWDAAAPHYEESWGQVLKPAHDALLGATQLGLGQQVIEVACGTGLVTSRVAELVGPTGNVLATDLSAQMVGRTRQRCDQFGFTNVLTERMDAQELRVEDSQFDAALCALGLMYVPDTQAAICEMARVVRPGGIIAVTVWGERNNCGWADIFPIVDRQVASEVCPLFFGLGARGALRYQFAQAKLLEVEEMRQSATMVFHNQQDLLRAMIDGGAVALAAKRFSADVRQNVENEFLSSVEQWRSKQGGYAIPGEFVTAKGILKD